MRNEIEKLIKRGHLKNFVKKEIASGNRPKDRRELVRERAVRPVNNESSKTINMIVREEMGNPAELTGREGVAN